MTLHEQQVLFAQLLPDLIGQAFVLGFDVVMGETYRTPEQAARNAATGAGIAHSLHVSRLAVDLLLFDKAGKWLKDSEAYRPLGEWWERQHPLACWGGKFTRPDGGHFSLTRDGIK